MLHFVALSAAFSLFVGEIGQVKASSQLLSSVLACAQDLAASATAREFARLQNGNLPKQVAAVARDRLQKAAPLYARKGGQGLTFMFRPPGVQMKTLALFQGEINQSQFIASILQQAFPSANYRITGDMNGPDLHHENIPLVNIRVIDTGEFESLDYTDQKLRESLITMQMLKPANPVGATADRNLIRQRLGIRPNDKVIHIYTDYGDQYENTDEIVQWAAENFDYVIYSDKHYDAVGAQHRRNKHGREELLSHRLDVEPTARIDSKFIKNNMRGVMPALYAASDLAIVLGPFNSWEALQVGTRVVNVQPEINLNKAVLNDSLKANQDLYYARVFTPMFRPHVDRRLALQISGPFSDSIPQIKGLMALGRIPILDRPFMRGVDGKSPIEAVIERLGTIVENQTRKN